MDRQGEQPFDKQPLPALDGHGRAVPDGSMLRAFLSICKDIASDDDILSAGLSCLDPSKLICPICHARTSLIYHGYYLRHLVGIKDGKPDDRRIKVIRLRCISCNTTHAVLPLIAIPYCAFSIRFIARLILDHTEGTFQSIEALCAHYKISVNTFFRLKHRYLSCIRLTFGITAGTKRAISFSRDIITFDATSLSCLLEGFFLATDTSFCQGHFP